MEEYNQMNINNSTPGRNFLYPSKISENRRADTSESRENMVHMNSFQLNFSNFEAENHVKTESSSSQHARQFYYPHYQELCQSTEVESIKAKIVAHPQYPKLLDAYMDYQNVGAPLEVVGRLSAARLDAEARQRFSGFNRDSTEDPELDRFMESYCEMLVKSRDELKRTLQEAMDFMQRMEDQLNTLSDAPVRILNSAEHYEDAGTSEDQENSGEESELQDINPRADDRELKNHLLKKYSGYLSGLKQELSKKRKKGKLPKDARQKLVSWWEQHYKWPYPSEAEKTALAESTSLDQKQINNWFINQRKRHWRPSEDMHVMTMEGFHAQSAALYMEGHYMGNNSPYRLGP